jgi:hypothetical protein
MSNGTTMTGDITVDQFRALVPAFSDPDQYPDATIQQYINLCPIQFNQCIWGSKLIFGEAMWIAHWMTLYGAGNGTGPPIAVGAMSSYATSKKVGDTSVSYSEGVMEKMFDNPYLLTPYGREYWFMVTHLAGIGLMIV